MPIILHHVDFAEIVMGFASPSLLRAPAAFYPSYGLARIYHLAKR